MKIQKNRHKILIPLIISAIALSAFVAYFLLAPQLTKQTANKEESGQPTSYRPPSQPEIDAGNNQKNETVTGKEETTDIKGTFSALNKTSSVLQIRILIEGIVNGTCTLEMKKDSSKIEKTVSIQPLANSSTCQGFDVPLDSLSPGSWNVVVTIKSGLESKTLTRSVDV